MSAFDEAIAATTQVAAPDTESQATPAEPLSSFDEAMNATRAPGLETPERFGPFAIMAPDDLTVRYVTKGRDMLATQDRTGLSLGDVVSIYDKIDADALAVGPARQTKVNEEVQRRRYENFNQNPDVQQFQAAGSPTIIERIKQWIRERTGYFEPPIYGGPEYREEHRLRTVGRLGAFYTAEALTGLGLNIPDIVAHKITGEKGLAEAVNALTGFEPDETEIRRGEQAEFTGGLIAAGGITSGLIRRVAARQALKTILASGVTMGSRRAAEEISQKVISGDPIDVEGIHFEAGIGVLFGVGVVGLERFLRFIEGVRAGKAIVHVPGAAPSAGPGAGDVEARTTARKEINEALRQFKETGDRTEWDRVRDKYMGLGAYRKGPAAPVEPVDAEKVAARVIITEPPVSPEQAPIRAIVARGVAEALAESGPATMDSALQIVTNATNNALKIIESLQGPLTEEQIAAAIDNGLKAAKDQEVAGGKEEAAPAAAVPAEGEALVAGRAEAAAKGPEAKPAKMPEHGRTAEGLIVVESDIGQIQIPEEELTGEYGKDLETIFAYGNFQRDVEQPGLRRSLSVGDTIQYRGHTLMPMSQGWRDITGLSQDAVKAIQTSENAIGLAASWRQAEERLRQEAKAKGAVAPEPTVLKPSGLPLTATIFNTPRERFEGYAWRTMSRQEYDKLMAGEKRYGGKPGKVPTRGNFLAPTPESAAQYKQKGKILVEFGGVEKAEGETVANEIGRENVTTAYEWTGTEWKSLEPPPTPLQAAPAEESPDVDAFDDLLSEAAEIIGADRAKDVLRNRPTLAQWHDTFAALLESDQIPTAEKEARQATGELRWMMKAEQEPLAKYRATMPNATELEIVHALIQDDLPVPRNILEKYPDDPAVEEALAELKQEDMLIRTRPKETQPAVPASAKPSAAAQPVMPARPTPAGDVYSKEAFDKWWEEFTDTGYRDEYLKNPEDKALEYLADVDEEYKDTEDQIAELDQQDAQANKTEIDRLGDILQEKRERMAAIIGGKPLAPPPAKVKEMPAVTEIVQLPTESIKADPKRFQYKLEATLPGGVTERLATVEKWNPKAGGVILVWEDKTGQCFVVDGHHRLALAKKLGIESINAYVVREAEGVSAEAARVLGATSNLADEKGTPIDAAKLFRDSNMSLADLKKEGVDVKSEIVKQGIAMKGLSDEVFRMVIDGKIPANMAAKIGENVENPVQQKQVADIIAQGGVQTVREAELLARTIDSAPILTKSEQTLFGVQTTEKSLYAERAKLLSNVETVLKTNKKVFGVLSQKTGMIEAAGNVLAKEANVQAKQRADEILYLLERLVNMKGPVSEALNEATKRYAENPTKERLAEVTKELLDKWESELTLESVGKIHPGVPKPGDEAVSLFPPEPPLPGGPPAGGKPGSPVAGPGIDTGRIKVSMEPTGRIISAREIIEKIARDFNITIRGKATHTMRARAGWYDPHSWGIRLKDVRELTTAMHEAGHYIDWHINERWSKKPPSPEIAKELVALGKILYGKIKPPGGYKSEGWAEFIRLYLTGEDTAKDAPRLTEWFTQTYLRAEPDTARKLAETKDLITQWRQQGAEARIESQINRTDIKGPFSERVQQAMLWADTMFRDELAPLRWAMKEVGLTDLPPSEDPYTLSVAFADKAPAKAREFVLHATTDIAGNVTGPGLREVVAPVAGEIEQFTRWVVAYRSRILHARGINPGIAQLDADYVYAKYDSPKYQKAAQDITAWNHQLLDYLKEAGGLTDEAISKIKQLNPIYVPFIRAFARGEVQQPSGVGTGPAKTGQPIKRIKGSGREIVEPFESMIQRAERIISTAQKIAVARAMAKLADKEGMASLIWKVPPPTEATKFAASQIKEQLKRLMVEQFGIAPEEIMENTSDAAWEEILTVYTNAGRYYGKDNIVALVVNGERQFYEVAPQVYRVLEGLDQYTLPWFLNLTFGKATRAVRMGATSLSPSFGLVRNFIRDALTFMVQAKHAKAGPLSAVGGVVSDVAQTVEAQKFKFLGGKMSGQILQDRIATQHLRREMLATSPGRWLIHTARHPINALRELFGVPEAGTRIAEFGAALKYANKKWGKGSLDAAVYALNQAQDVTTNFTRHGRIGKVLNQAIPFFNAALQGPDKMLRTFRERPVATLLKAIAGLTVPAVVLWWMEKDEEWYKRLSDREKANYLHFRIPATETIVRIPIPFELGYIFQALPVAALDQMYQEDPGQVNDILGETAARSNPVDWPALVGPVIDIMQNRQWNGSPIVTEYMKNMLPEDRYYPYTTELMKYVGEQLGASPAQIEYLVNSYTGGLYGRASGAISLALDGKKGDFDIVDVPVFGTLFVREPYRPSEKIEKFYNRLTDLQEKHGSDKATPAENAERLQLDRVSRNLLAPLWKRLREEGLTDEEKRQIYTQMEIYLDRVSQ